MFLLQPADSGPDLSSTHMTLDSSTQPDNLVVEINEGNSYCPSGTNQLIITDVHLTPSDAGTRVIVRAELQGPMEGEGIVYADTPSRLRRTIDINTNRT